MGTQKSTKTRLLMVATSLAVAAGVLAAPSASHAAGSLYYLSLGDSYSVGYQPGIGATAGYTGVVAAAKGMTLENFGCGGATTASILTFDDSYCGITDAINNPLGYGPAAITGNPATLGQTQAQAADAFIAAHQGQIGLITVSISGNDVTGCALAASPITCIVGLLPVITTNVKALMSDLRGALGAAGKKVPIVGLTYPDVLLGDWVNAGGTPTFPPSVASENLAKLSVQAFQGIPGVFAGINPTLQAAYKTGKAKFVDVTKKTGAYQNLKKMTTITLAPLGSITVPKAVAEVCTLTYYCSLGNIHANTTGYNLIGSLINKVVK